MGLPEGFTFDNKTGTLRGTPSATGEINIYIAARNAFGFSEHGVINIDVAPSEGSPPQFNVVDFAALAGKDSSHTIRFSGTDVTTVITASDLPNGLHTVTRKTSAIDLYLLGTPTTPGKYDVQVSASNLYGATTKAIPYWVLPDHWESSLLKADLTCIGFGAEKYFVCALGKIFSSADGRMWTLTAGNLPIDSPFVDFENHGNLLVAATRSGQIYTSNTGTDWKLSTLFARPYFEEQHQVIVTGNGQIVAINQHQIIASTTGNEWSTTTVDSVGNCITFGGGKFVIGATGKVLLSDDGLTWDSVGGFPNDFTSVAYAAHGNGVLLLGDGSDTIVRSVNWGKTWETVRVEFFVVRSITFGNGQFLVTGESSGVLVSELGKAFHSHPINTSDSVALDLAAFGNGRFLVGSRGVAGSGSYPRCRSRIS